MCQPSEGYRSTKFHAAVDGTTMRGHDYTAHLEFACKASWSDLLGSNSS